MSVDYMLEWSEPTDVPEGGHNYDYYEVRTHRSDSFLHPTFLLRRVSGFDPLPFILINFNNNGGSCTPWANAFSHHM